MATEKKTCFFVTPIGAEGSEIRNRSDWILNYMLKPAIGSRYELVRADQISEPGSITAQIVQLIADAHLTVVDLTGLNANVAYELGIRHAFNKPSVQLMDHDQALPFDLIGERTIFFKHDDVRSLEKAKAELRRAIKQTEKDGFVPTSPVSRAVDLANLLERSSNATDQLATILQEVINIKDMVDSVSTDFALSDVEHTVDEIKDMVERLAPQKLDGRPRGGIYIDNGYIIRLLEDVELLLKRTLERTGRSG